MKQPPRFTFYVLRFRHLIVLALYLALALVLTYPLVAQFGDHVPGTTTWSLDEYGYVWNNWWLKHALFDLGVNPFQTNFIAYPIGVSLVLYTFTLLHVLLGLPIQFAFGLIPASNVELLFAFVLSGYGTFLLAYFLMEGDWRLETRDAPISNLQSLISAFIAGALFAFSSNRFVYASLGHYNVVATEWIPFYILFLVKTVRESKWKNALLAGLFAAFALYVETTDGVLLALFTLLYLLFAGRAVWRRAVVARLAVIGATAALFFAPLLLPTLNEIWNSGYTLPGWGHAEKLLVDLFGLITPTSLHPLNRHWEQELDLVRQGISRFVDVNTVFLGYVTLALAGIAAVRYWKTLKVWAISAIAFAILSLGPLLHINGQSLFDFDGLQVTFPLPFLLLHYIPLLRENRVPNRFSILVMLSLAVLVGFAVAWILARVSRITTPLKELNLNRKDAKNAKFHNDLLRVFAAKMDFFQESRITHHASRFTFYVLFCLLLAALLFEHLSIPLPLTDARVPEVYSQIARDPGDFAVLTLPLGWRNSFGQQGAEDTRVQYYQSAHGKYIFPANIQRNPPFLFDYFDRVPVFHSLTQIEFYNNVSEQDLARDKALAPGLMTFFDVRYVVIHPAIPGRPPYSDTRAAVVNYVQQVLPLGDKIYDRDGVLAYRINQPPLPSKQQIAFGTAAAGVYQAEGWDRAETIAGESANWANQREARVLFPVRDLADYRLTVRARPFVNPQTVELLVNAQPIAKFEMQAGWQDYAVTIPARALRAGLNDLVLRFGNVARPRDVLSANYAIGSTGATSPVDIVVNSGELGSIQVDGREQSLLGRGYNVVVVDPKTGAIVSAKVFNTADDIAQSRAMTDFIAKIPDGFIVAVAAQGDVGTHLGDRTVAALRSIGAQADLRATPQRSHTIIGVKGVVSGAAVEQSNVGASFIAVGRSADERTLAAAVSVMTIEKR